MQTYVLVSEKMTESSVSTGKKVPGNPGIISQLLYQCEIILNRKMSFAS